MAITCPNTACNAGFCGYCFEHCGIGGKDVAYPHVKACKHNPSANTSSPYTRASEDHIRLARNIYKAIRIKEYLDTSVEDSEMERVLAGISQNLQGLGITVEQIRSS
jgi:hypothetical protein